LFRRNLDFLRSLQFQLLTAVSAPRKAPKRRDKNSFLNGKYKSKTVFFYKYANKEQIEKFPDHFDYLVKNTQKYIF